MNLVARRSTGALVKNPNGTLRKGVWRFIQPDPTHWYRDGVSTGTSYAFSQVQAANNSARLANSWYQAEGDGITWFDAMIGTAFGEDYPYYDPQYYWSRGVAKCVCYRFHLPYPTPIKSVVLNVYGGGATLLEFGAYPDDYVPVPLFPNAWTYTSPVAWKFYTGWPMYPYAAFYGATPHITLSTDALTQCAVADSAQIVSDSSGYWTMFDAGSANIYAPSSVVSMANEVEYLYLGVWFRSPTSFSIPSNHSRAEHAQNARAGVPALWVYC